MVARGMDPARQGQAGRWVRTMGARESPVSPLMDCGAAHRQMCDATWHTLGPRLAAALAG